MADNLSAGNPRAHAIRVHFVDTSTKIYEGMPVCYNFDTTSNWFGGSVSDAGVVTASTTLTAGSPDTAQAKYLEVELPSATNIQWFAGVVKKGGWVGKTTSATSGVGQILDIYTPNGAIVPVRTDSNCLIGQTILAITIGQSELGVPLATDSRAVAISEETVNRDTAGLVLAKLDPNLFIYQDHAGTALSVDDASTTTSTLVNHSNINFLGSAVYNRCLYMIGTINAGSCSNGMFKFRTYVTHDLNAASGHAQAVCCNLHFQGDDAGLRGSNGEISSALYVTVETESTTAADLSSGDVACIQCCSYIDDGCTSPGSIYGLFFHSIDASKHVFTHLLGARHAADIGFVVGTNATPDHMIPIEVAGATYYICCVDSLT